MTSSDPGEVNDVKLAPAHRRILSILEAHGRISPTRIGEIAFPGATINSARSMAARHLRDLRDYGLVEEHPSEAGDQSSTKLYALKNPQTALTWNPRAQLQSEISRRFHELPGEGSWRERPRHHISIAACQAATEMLEETAYSKPAVQARALALTSMLRAPQTRSFDESISSFVQTNLPSNDALLHIMRACVGYVDFSQRRRRHRLYEAMERAWNSDIPKGSPLAKICGMLSVPIAIRQNDELLRYRLLGKVLDGLGTDYLSGHIRGLALMAMNRMKEARAEWARLASPTDLDEAKSDVPSGGREDFFETCRKIYGFYAQANLALAEEDFESTLEYIASSWLRKHGFPTRWAREVRAGDEVFEIEAKLNERHGILTQGMLGEEANKLVEQIKAAFPHALKDEPTTSVDGSVEFYSLSRSPGRGGIASLMLDNQDSLGWILLTIHRNALE